MNLPSVFKRTGAINDLGRGRMLVEFRPKVLPCRSFETQKTQKETKRPRYAFVSFGAFVIFCVSKKRYAHDAIIFWFHATTLRRNEAYPT